VHRGHIASLKNLSTDLSDEEAIERCRSGGAGSSIGTVSIRVCLPFPRSARCCPKSRACRWSLAWGTAFFKPEFDAFERRPYVLVVVSVDHDDAARPGPVRADDEIAHDRRDRGGGQVEGARKGRSAAGARLRAITVGNRRGDESAHLAGRALRDRRCRSVAPIGRKTGAPAAMRRWNSGQASSARKTVSFMALLLPRWRRDTGAGKELRRAPPEAGSPRRPPPAGRCGRADVRFSAVSAPRSAWRKRAAACRSGATALTRMSGASSLAHERVSPRIAALVAT